MTAEIHNRWRVALQACAGAIAFLLVAWAYWPGISGPAILDDARSVSVLEDQLLLGVDPVNLVFSDPSGPVGRPLSIASLLDPVRTFI